MYKSSGGIMRYFYVPYHYNRTRNYRSSNYRWNIGSRMRVLINSHKPDRTNPKMRSDIFKHNVEMRKRFSGSMYNRWY